MNEGKKVERDFLHSTSLYRLLNIKIRTMKIENKSARLSSIEERSCIMLLIFFNRNSRLAQKMDVSMY